jgi:hypothetical protein
MPTIIEINFPDGREGAGRFELEERLEDFFGAAAELVGSGSGLSGSDLLFELADSEDAGGWVAQLCEFLRAADARRGTWLAVFPDGWEPGEPVQGVKVFE